MGVHSTTIRERDRAFDGTALLLAESHTQSGIGEVSTSSTIKSGNALALSFVAGASAGAVVRAPNLFASSAPEALLADTGVSLTDTALFASRSTSQLDVAGLSTVSVEAYTLLTDTSTVAVAGIRANSSFALLAEELRVALADARSDASAAL